MPEFAKKTCNFCGIRDIQPNMLRIQKTYQTTIKNAATKRDVIGSLLGSKISQKSLGKSLMSGGGRVATRQGEVWSCYGCQDLETPADKKARETRLEDATEKLNALTAKMASEKKQKESADEIWVECLNYELEKASESNGDALKTDGLLRLEQELKSLTDTPKGKHYTKSISSIVAHFSHQLFVSTENKKPRSPDNFEKYPESEVISNHNIWEKIPAYFLIFCVSMYLVSGFFIPDGFTLDFWINWFVFAFSSAIVYVPFHILISFIHKVRIKRRIKKYGDLKPEIIKICSLMHEEYNSLNEGIIERTRISALQNKEFSDVYAASKSNSNIDHDDEDDVLENNRVLKELLKEIYSSKNCVKIIQYSLLTALASSDGATSDEESRTLDVYASSLTTKEKQIAHSVISYGGAALALIKILNKNLDAIDQQDSSQKDEVKHLIFQSLIDICLADGELHEEELSLLNQFAQPLHISSEKLKELLKITSPKDKFVIDEALDQEIDDILDEVLEEV